jgi:hypothetical protein
MKTILALLAFAFIFYCGSVLVRAAFNPNQTYAATERKSQVSKPDVTPDTGSEGTRSFFKSTHIYSDGHRFLC